MSIEEEKVSFDKLQQSKPTYIRHRPMLGVIGKFATQHSDDVILYRLVKWEIIKCARAKMEKQLLNLDRPVVFFVVL